MKKTSKKESRAAIEKQCKMRGVMLELVCDSVGMSYCNFPEAISRIQKLKKFESSVIGKVIIDMKAYENLLNNQMKTKAIDAGAVLPIEEIHTFDKVLNFLSSDNFIFSIGLIAIAFLSFQIIRAIYGY